MKKISIVLLFIFTCFVQLSFPQKKFIATELSVTEGLQGKETECYLIIQITKSRLIISDGQGVMNEIISQGKHFGKDKIVKAYDTYTQMYCTVFMYNTITITYKGSNQILWFKGTYYY